MATPTYTFTQKAEPSEPNQLNWYGNLRRDGSKQPMTGPMGNGIQTTDATTPTAINSATTVTSTSSMTLNSPVNATTLNFCAASATTTATLNVSEVSGMASYFTVPLNQVISMDCGLQQPFYFEANTASVTLSFWYTIV